VNEESQLSGDTGTRQRAMTVSVLPVANYLWPIAHRLACRYFARLMDFPAPTHYVQVPNCRQPTGRAQ
jgi:hypothetical protein